MSFRLRDENTERQRENPPMVLSEAEAELQLADLRQQREALDRAISDLTLYLELGRRLRSGTAAPIETGRTSVASPGETKTEGWSSNNPQRPVRAEDHAGSPPPAPIDRDGSAERRWPSSVRRVPVPSSSSAEERSSSPAPRKPDPHGEVNTAAADGAVPSQRDGMLSEGVLARRYGRALIEAALAVLEEAGRPLHASEILAVLTSRGFSLPGHDPVAALNTRLWKRSGSGGPIKRMGDAVYALVEPKNEGLPQRQPMGDDEG